MAVEGSSHDPHRAHHRRRPGGFFMPGRRPTLTASQIEHARKLIDDEGRSVAEVAGILNVHRATLYRALSSH